MIKFLIKGFFLLILCLIPFLGTNSSINFNPELASIEWKVLDFAQRHAGEDVLVVAKEKRLLYYVKNGRIVRGEKWDGFEINFPVRIALGANPNYWTPEGEYFICTRNLYSRFTKFLGISYPSVKDVNTALARGSFLNKNQIESIKKATLSKEAPPWNTPLGGTFGIHAGPTYQAPYLRKLEKQNPDLVYVTQKDNTRGCVAVETRVIDYLFSQVALKTPLLIMP